MLHSPVVVCAPVPYPSPHIAPSLQPPPFFALAAAAIAKSREMEDAVGVSPDTLVSLLSGQELGATLVLDCRSFMAYNKGHVVGALNAHCPPILKRRSGGVLALENMVLERRERERLLAGGYGCVVVYDQATRDLAQPVPQSDLPPVLSSLHQQVHGPRLFFLAGGYDAFSENCPFLCATQQFSPLISVRSEHNQCCVSDEQPVEILPHLLLGSGVHSSDLHLLQDLGVTALVNVSSGCINHFPAHFRYLHIPVHDSASADLTDWFPQANVFIDKVKAEGGRVLVHCRAGRSRSATICLAYLMKTLDLTLDDAFEHVRSRRQVIDPNLNFMRQLQDYRQHLDQERSLGSGATLLIPSADTAFLHQALTQSPREAVAPISLPSSLESGLLPPASSAALIPPPSPATASDIQFFFTFTSPEFSLSSDSLARTPEIPLPS